MPAPIRICILLYNSEITTNVSLWCLAGAGAGAAAILLLLLGQTTTATTTVVYTSTGTGGRQSIHLKTVHVCVRSNTVFHSLEDVVGAQAEQAPLEPHTITTRGLDIYTTLQQ